jgi:hypothetical protein
MPYMDDIYQEGDQYCVYKKTPDGSRGEKVGCSDSEEKARAYLQRLNQVMEEESRGLVRPTQTEVHYKLMHGEKEAGCVGCRWFNMAEKYCHIIENGPEDILPTGHCDRHEPMKDMEMEQPESLLADEPLSEPLPETISDSDPEADKQIYASPTSNAPGVFKQIMERFKGGLKPGTSILKGIDGKRYMFIVTSNSYKDRENEIISTEALKRYVDSEWLAEDYFAGTNDHLIWHDDRLNVGKIVWADMAGPFLVEVAREGDTIIAKAAYDYWEQHGDDLGASHRFKFYGHERDVKGVYHNIRKTETSTLPRENAANLLTYSGVLPMSKSREDHLDAMFGIEGVAALLKDGPQKLEAALEAKGVQHKSTDVDPAQATDKAENSFAALVLALTEAQAETLKEMDAIKALLQDSVTAQQAEKASAEQVVKQLTDELAAVKAEMKLAPRSVASNLSAEEAAKAEAEITTRQQKPENDVVGRLQALIEGKG